ncbi:SpoIIE family protein phosphatase [Streptomyces aquilus]|uniref:SpoIIE family protein phosphatase n=1 Tax=Streptomyces aquilus TaxID=2548456 RepID=UPI00369D4A7F
MRRQPDTTSPPSGPDGRFAPGGPPFSPRTVPRAESATRILAGLSALLGTVGLVGWGVPASVRSAWPGAEGWIKANTALSLTLLALGLGMVADARQHGLRLLVGRSVLLCAGGIGLASLAEYVFGICLGIDQFLVADDTAGLLPDVASPPGRMAPNTAVALMLASCAGFALTLNRETASAAAQTMGLLVLLLGLLRWYGLAYRVPELGKVGDYIGMAPHTAAILVLLGSAIFLARPRSGLAALLCNAGTTGMLGRRMIATILLVPPLLGWLRLTGQDAGWYGTRVGVALLVCGHVCVFLLLGFLTLETGRRVEAAHNRARGELIRYQWLQQFMEHTPAIVFMKDLKGRYLAVNAEFERAVGRSRDTVVGMLTDEVLPADFAASARAADAEVLDSGQARRHEHHVPTANGVRVYSDILFPLPGTDGRPQAICGIATDDTLRVTAQQQAEHAHQRFRDLMESAPDAIVIVGRDDTVVMANARAEALFGHPRSHLLGLNLSQLTPPSRQRRQTALVRSYRALAAGRPVTFDSDLRGMRADGREFPAEVSIGTLQSDDGRLISVAVRDITERRRLEEEHHEAYRQQRRIAYTLQHSLMGTPPLLPHLPTAYRYLPSAQDAGVGGDWFDVIPLDKGRTGIVIGDVMGRGIDAAAVMGQLRAATHALAKAEMAPAQLMNCLDTFVCELDGQLVTCCYLVLDPHSDRITLCSAGHLPVLAAAQGRPPRALDAPVSVPLGIGGIPHRQTTHALPAGTTLLAYTDGLVELPGADLDDRIGELTDAFATALKPSGRTHASLEILADDVLRSLISRPEKHDDDVTLLAVRAPAHRTTSTALTPEPKSASQARHFAARTLTGWNGPADVTETAELIVTELVTNAIQHAKSDFPLALHLDETELTIEVGDHERTEPSPRTAGPLDENGRGLLLVSALAERWGTSPHSQGKTIWCTLPWPTA